MDTYIIDRVRATADHTLALAQIEERLQHQGMKGRFRELLIDNILAPWLPPYTSCGTGMIIAAENRMRRSTQDDIIIYDKSLTPPVLVSTAHAPEGVFLYNSVLARIEVKSQLTRADIRSFVKSSCDMASLKHTTHVRDVPSFVGTLNLLFAFGSDATGGEDPDFQLRRLIEVMREEQCDPLSGIVSMICVPPFGFWKINERDGDRIWQRLEPNSPANNLAWFVACISSTTYLEHARRQGRDPKLGLEGGIGMYFPSPYVDAQA